MLSLHWCSGNAFSEPGTTGLPSLSAAAGIIDDTTPLNCSKRDELVRVHLLPEFGTAPEQHPEFPGRSFQYGFRVDF